MPRLSTRMMKFAIAPISLTLLVLAMCFPPSSWRVGKPISPNGGIQLNAQDTEVIRMMAARNQSIEDLMWQLANDEIGLVDATNQFLDLNSQNRGFIVSLEVNHPDLSIQESACLVMLRRLKAVLGNEPELLSHVAARMHLQFEASYGTSLVNVTDQEPVI